MKPVWQEAAVHAMFASVAIAVFGRPWWREIGFWISLVLSSGVHVVIVHSWVQRVGRLSRGQGKLAVLLGFGLFIAVYGLFILLQWNLYPEEAHDHSSKSG